MENQLVSVLAKTSIRLVAGIGVATFLLPQASWAQMSYPPNLQSQDTFQNQNERSLMGENSGSFNPFDLIHRAQYGTLDINEYNNQQRVNLTNSADLFRRQQMERLRQLNQASVEEQAAPQ